MTPGDARGWWRLEENCYQDCYHHDCAGTLVEYSRSRLTQLLHSALAAVSVWPPLDAPRCLAYRHRVVTAFGEAEDGRWLHNIVIDRFHESDGVLAAGYQRAAELVVAAWVDGETDDSLFTPLVLLYRHAIELELKEAIRAATSLAEARGERPEFSFEEIDSRLASPKSGGGHDLTLLNSRLATLLELVSCESLDDDVQAVLGELAQLDPTGETFRYSKVKGPGKANGPYRKMVRAPRPVPRPSPAAPTDQDGQKDPSVLVDVVRLAAVFGGALRQIGGCVDALSALRDGEEEYTADLASEAGYDDR